MVHNRSKSWYHVIRFLQRDYYNNAYVPLFSASRRQRENLGLGGKIYLPLELTFYLLKMLSPIFWSVGVKNDKNKEYH